MSEQSFSAERRTLLAGKIVSDFGQSSIDCVVRRLSERGATVTTESPLGIPKRFHLLIPNEGPPKPAKLVWQSGNEIGLEFDNDARDPASPAGDPTEHRGDTLMRGQMLALRSAMDEIETGVVLLDADLRAQFINRAFRKMWVLSDTFADSKPSYVALLHHGRDTGAYEVPTEDMDDYIAERTRTIRSGDQAPRDIRRTDGTVLRVQCAVLPNGGRMLSYADVTDIVRHSDQLESLRNALDNISDGVLLLDTELRARFLNRKVRDYFGVTAEQVAAHPTYLELITNAPDADKHDLPPDQLEALFARRVEAARTATPAAADRVLPDGRTIRMHCGITPDGGRLMTFCDITDLIRNAELLEKLATMDAMTGLYNRRHFMVLAEAEWSRFQRYQRPLSMLMLDVDHFNACRGRARLRAG